MTNTEKIAENSTVLYTLISEVCKIQKKEKQRECKHDTLCIYFYDYGVVSLHADCHACDKRFIRADITLKERRVLKKLFKKYT